MGLINGSPYPPPPPPEEDDEPRDPDPELIAIMATHIKGNRSDVSNEEAIDSAYEIHSIAQERVKERRRQQRNEQQS